RLAAYHRAVSSEASGWSGDRRRMAAGVLLVLVAGAALLPLAWDALRPDDVAANEAFIEELAPYPGSIERGRDSYPYGGDSFFSGTDSWGTRVTYELPAGTTEAEVIAHYRSAA